MTADELTALNEQIAALSRAGLPLDQGLAELARDMDRGPLRSVTAALAQDLQNGTPLPDAVAKQKTHLPPYYAALILAGMKSGRLAEVFATITSYIRSMSLVRRIIIDSLFYPCVILTLGYLLIVGLAFFVLPQFEQTFSEFGMKLPRITEFVLYFAEHRYLLLAAPAVVFAGLLLLRLTLKLLAPDSVLWAKFVYAIPVLGTLIRSARLASFSELLSLLVDHDVPLSEAYRLAGEASPDPLTRSEARAVVKELENGQSLGTALRGRGLVPEWVAWMSASGEQRGNLAQSLRQIAVVYRQQVEVRAALLRMVLPPFLIVSTAGVVTVVFVLALMTPMIKLLEGLAQ